MRATFATRERVTAAVENVLEADDVRLHVRVRILDRISNASLSGEMNDAAESMRRKQRLHGAAIGDIEFLKAKAASRFKARQSCKFEVWVVVVVEVVDANDFITAVEQRRCDVRTDEACAASDKNSRRSDGRVCHRRECDRSWTLRDSSGALVRVKLRAAEGIWQRVH